jgi:hypothetical protein
MAPRIVKNHLDACRPAPIALALMPSGLWRREKLELVCRYACREDSLFDLPNRWLLLLASPVRAELTTQGDDANKCEDEEKNGRLLEPLVFEEVTIHRCGIDSGLGIRRQVLFRSLLTRGLPGRKQTCRVLATGLSRQYPKPAHKEISAVLLSFGR